MIMGGNISKRETCYFLKCKLPIESLDVSRVFLERETNEFSSNFHQFKQSHHCNEKMYLIGKVLFSSPTLIITNVHLHFFIKKYIFLI